MLKLLEKLDSLNITYYITVDKQRFTVDKQRFTVDNGIENIIGKRKYYKTKDKLLKAIKKGTKSLFPANNIIIEVDIKLETIDKIYLDRKDSEFEWDKAVIWSRVKSLLNKDLSIKIPNDIDSKKDLKSVSDFILSETISQVKTPILNLKGDILYTQSFKELEEDVYFHFDLRRAKEYKILDNTIVVRKYAYKKQIVDLMIISFESINKVINPFVMKSPVIFENIFHITDKNPKTNSIFNLVKNNEDYYFKTRKEDGKE